MPQTIDNLSVTWANSLTTFTAFKFNAVDNASAAGSLLMDLQVGGSSRFSISKAGRVFGVQSADNATPTFSFIGRTTDGIANPNGQIYFIRGGVAEAKIAGGLTLSSDAFVRWSSSTIDSAADLFLSRRAAANLRLGFVDAAAPVAQTLSVQSVVAGTTNTAGANLTITGSQGTGTGAGGSIVFQVAPAGSSGTAQNALATALTIDSTRLATFAGLVRAQSNVTIDGLQIITQSGSNEYARLGLGNFQTIANQYIGWTSSTTSADGSLVDVRLFRDAANTLALRNGANAQSFRVYNTTDGTNSEFGKIAWSSNTLVIGVETAGTGSNRVIELRNTGVRFVRIPTTGGMQLFNSANREVYIQWDAIGVRADAAFLWSSSSTSIGEGSGDTGLVRAAANIVRVTNGSTGGGSLQLTEMTAPSAPATDNVRIYAEDNGSGKTRLMALFPTGAAVQIAIEP